MKEYTLPKENGHMVYYAEYGNPEGPAIIHFHGGPGDGSKLHHAERFDLEKYRIILFDQRGCGKSTPLGEVKHNTTQDILKDAERIRLALGVSKWFVAGSSWGATCAVLYAIEFPDKVRGLILSSLFLAHSAAEQWLLGAHGAAILLPDVWERRMVFFKKFNIHIETQNKDMFTVLERATEEEARELAAGIFEWEGSLYAFGSDVLSVSPDDIDEKAVASVKIFLHYAMNNNFLRENHILESVSFIANIPTVVAQGRCDIICPAKYTYDFVQKMNSAELVHIPSSGHKLTPEGNMIRNMTYSRFLKKYT